MAGRALTITYLADAKSALAAQKQIDAGHTQMQTGVTKTGGVFKSTFGSMIPIAAVAAGAAIVKFGADSIKAAIEAEQAMAQTEARIKSTGGSANVTATDVVGLADRLRNLSGVDDEVIQSSENLLLTFTKVRNEVGAGNDIFNQAEKAILNMATGMNEGAIPSSEQLQSSTTRLGKALNDPIAGLTSLSKAGVQFTDEQKEQIRTMVESGDVMGAQKVILAELETQFGGAAEAAGDTFGGQMAILQSKIGDVQEVIGGALLPTLSELADTFSEILSDVEPLIDFFAQGLAAAVSSVADEVTNFIEPLTWILEHLPDLNSQVDEGSSIWDRWGDAVGTGFEKAVGAVVPGSQAFYDLQNAQEAASEGSHENLDIVGTLSAAYRGAFAEAMDTAAEKTTLNENATQALTDAQRENRLATLALTDSYLGIIDSANDVAEAERELDRLRSKGKQGTKEYEAAALEAIEANLGLEESILSYAGELIEAGKSQGAVNREIREAGNEAGLTKAEVNKLIDEVRDLIKAGDDYDGRTFRASVVTDYSATGNTPSELRGLQHGGIVTKPGIFHVGEAGPEAVIPLNKAGGALGNITINVAGSVVTESELAEVIRRQLIRSGDRNGDIFGGRA